MCNCQKNSALLSAPGISINQIIEALTDPAKRFEFPVKPFKSEIDLSNQTKGIILAAAVILGGALIYNATKK